MTFYFLSVNKVNTMNVFLLLLLLVGFVFIVIGFVKANKNCPVPRVEYRFVPRSFVEEQESPVPVTDIFARMFFESSDFLVNHGTRPLPPPTQIKDINKYFISQN